MSRLKFDYRKSKSFWSGTSWSCYVTDRKTNEEYTGYGDTKHEAKSAALDKYWAEKDSYRETSYNNDNKNDEPIKYSSSSYSASWEPNGRVVAIFICLILAILCGLASLWGYNFIHEERYMRYSNYSIQRGLGPIFSIVVMIGGAIGCIISIFGFFSVLSSKDY